MPTKKVEDKPEPGKPVQESSDVARLVRALRRGDADADTQRAAADELELRDQLANQTADQLNRVRRTLDDKVKALAALAEY